jgi:hypothetical protein
MIARLQKTKLISKYLLKQLREGTFPTVSETLRRVEEELDQRTFGTPLTRIRPAVYGYEVGGRLGTDLYDTNVELREDLDLLYQATLEEANRVLDIYNIFTVRRDRLSSRLAQFKTEVGTLLAKTSAGNHTSVADSFNNLDYVDLDQTTAYVNLSEGCATLPTNNTQSVRYDGGRVRVTKETLETLPEGDEFTGTNASLGTTRVNAAFEKVFSPYRVDAWFMEIPKGKTFQAIVNVTGADGQQGQEEEVWVNSIRLEPTGPLFIRVDWSPDGFNWHSLSPELRANLSHSQTFHFAPIRVGYFRFRIRPVEESRVVGLRTLQFFQRGYSSNASLYSKAWQFNRPVHTVVAELEQEIPFGTRLSAYVAQNEDGPWLPVGEGPVALNKMIPYTVEINLTEKEADVTPALYYRQLIEFSVNPLFESGEMTAGTDQVQLSAFPFDWIVHQDREHIPSKDDWNPAKAQVRSGCFRQGEDLDSGEITSGYFTTTKNPLITASAGGQEYLALAILPSGSSTFVLQPGYNYRLRTYLWCPEPVTLDRQRLGIVNTGASGSTSVGAFSLYVNQDKVYESKTFVASATALSGSTNQATFSLNRGWNELEIYLQLPSDLDDLEAANSSSIGSSIYLYFQPQIFAAQRTSVLGVETVRAYEKSWQQVSEFDLRYNTPPGVENVWSWLISRDEDTEGNAMGVLFNHDPANGRAVSASETDTPTQTLDGVNAGQRADLKLLYNVPQPDEDLEGGGSVLYFRADFTRDQTAIAPPILHSYRLITN